MQRMFTSNPLYCDFALQLRSAFTTEASYMHMLPPPLIIQALMLGLSFLLGIGIGRTLFARHFPHGAFGLTIGFAPIGWVLAFVSALVLRDPTNESDGQRPYPDWRAMEYMGWSHLAALIIGLVLLVLCCKLGSRAGNPAISIKTILLSIVILLISFVLVNTSGFVATLLWAGKGWVALPMVGYIFFVLAILAICMGVLRNQLSSDGPSWLQSSK